MSKSLETVMLKNISFKNSIVRSATFSRIGNQDGSISDSEMIMYKELARNNIGLIITGHCYVSSTGRMSYNQTSISDDSYIPRLKELVTMVKQFDCKIVAQISHAGAQTSVVDEPIAPSNIEMIQGHHARKLSLLEIEQIKQDFIHAAFRAKESGFDGVQVHVAHNYLLCQFVTPAFNHRTDSYGGSQKGRFRIVKEIIEGIKEKCGREYPVFVKINSNVESDEVQYFNDLVAMLKEFKILGVEAVEVSGYNFFRKGINEHNYYLDTVRALREQVDIPVIVVGGVRNFNDMDEMLNAGINMISLSRPLICEPDLITKLMEGQKESKCLSCNKCFSVQDKRCVLH